jgi:hypothetical protein
MQIKPALSVQVTKFIFYRTVQYTKCGTMTYSLAFRSQDKMLFFDKSSLLLGSLKWNFLRCGGTWRKMVFVNNFVIRIPKFRCMQKVLLSNPLPNFSLNLNKLPKHPLACCYTVVVKIN